MVQHSKTFQQPFRVTGAMTWKNEATGRTGSVPINTSVEKRQLFQPHVSVAAATNVQPGPGTLVVTVKVKPGTAPEAVCTGRFQIR
ncbi:hypothetical protein [Tsukamurella paurometabola]|uniref:Uncharacterized protein n=2 Tax=Tsukamurella paurometabola TaxID=2061 RepID=A0A3P8KTY6_TSUPA|nr:hypothetical protein [Tsukamurella paurometabola]VDR40357.1 Uncharacterised protein [Tsukamurella paurometabola]